MAADWLLDTIGIRGESSDERRKSVPPLSGLIRLKLERLGMTKVGVVQLAAGVPLSDANDRRLVERIVAGALGP